MDTAFFIWPSPFRFRAGVLGAADSAFRSKVLKQFFFQHPTRLNEQTATITWPNLSASVFFGGCGKGRVSGAQTHGCRGPADIQSIAR